MIDEKINLLAELNRLLAQVEQHLQALIQLALAEGVDLSGAHEDIQELIDHSVAMGHDLSGAYYEEEDGEE